MAASGWNTFTITANFNVSPEAVFNSWITSHGIEKWFLRKADFFDVNSKLKDKNSSVKSGDTYFWLWHGYPDDVFEKRKILECNGKDLLKFTFTDDCIVTVKVFQKNGITLLELTQENIKEEKDPQKNLFVQCQLGWTFYLANLKSILEGGVDLRNKNMNLHSNFK